MALGIDGVLLHWGQAISSLVYICRRLKEILLRFGEEIGIYLGKGSIKSNWCFIAMLIARWDRLEDEKEIGHTTLPDNSWHLLSLFTLTTRSVEYNLTRRCQKLFDRYGWGALN